MTKAFVSRAIFLTFIAVSANGCGYNSLQTADEQVKAAWAEVENQYTRRHELIPNLVSVVKGYAKHEAQTLQSVVEARAKATQTTVNVDSDAKSFENFQNAQSGLSSALSRLMVVVEKYPDLKANTQFRDLQAQLEGTENRIAVARKRYIDQVAQFNLGVRHFPTNLTAKFLLGMKPRETFTASAEQKEVPKVEF
ncbi:MAG: LemA family protein [Bacteriovoracia bacterium]